MLSRVRQSLIAGFEIGLRGAMGGGMGYGELLEEVVEEAEEWLTKWVVSWVSEEDWGLSNIGTGIPLTGELPEVKPSSAELEWRPLRSVFPVSGL